MTEAAQDNNVERGGRINIQDVIKEFEAELNPAEDEQETDETSEEKTDPETDEKSSETSEEETKEEEKADPNKQMFDMAEGMAQYEVKRRELERLEKKLSSRVSDLEKKESKQRDWEEKLRTDPLNALEERGIDFENMAKTAISDKTPEQKLYERKISDLEKKIDNLQSGFNESRQETVVEREQRAIRETKRGIASRYGEVGDGYHYLQEFDPAEVTDMVFDQMTKHYVETKEQKGEGEILDIIDVFGHLNTQFDKDYQRLARAAQKRTEKKTEKASEKTEEESPETDQKTLKNQESSERTNQPEPISRDQRIVDAKNWFQKEMRRQ